MHLYILGLDEDEADYDPLLNPDGLRDELPDGSQDLNLAWRLLEFINPRKGERFHHILEHELREEGSFHQIIPPLAVGRIVELLQDIEKDVSTVADDRRHLLPGPTADALANWPGMVETYADEEGRTIRSLLMTVGAVVALREFLVGALVRALAVAID